MPHWPTENHKPTFHYRRNEFSAVLRGALAVTDERQRMFVEHALTRASVGRQLSCIRSLRAYTRRVVCSADSSLLQPDWHLIIHIECI